jgi:hypothetical protein
MASSYSLEHGQTRTEKAMGKVFTTTPVTPPGCSHYAKTRDFCRIGLQKSRKIDDGFFKVRNMG